MVIKNAPLAYEKYTWGSGWLTRIINPRPITTNADCLRKIERSPWEALYKKNSPKVDKKKIEKNITDNQTIWENMEMILKIDLNHQDFILMW